MRFPPYTQSLLLVSPISTTDLLWSIVWLKILCLSDFHWQKEVVPTNSVTCPIVPFAWFLLIISSLVSLCPPFLLALQVKVGWAPTPEMNVTTTFGVSMKPFLGQHHTLLSSPTSLLTLEANPSSTPPLSLYFLLWHFHYLVFLHWTFLSLIQVPSLIRHP